MEMPNFKCVGSSEEQTEESRKFGAEDKINSKGKKKKKDNIKERTKIWKKDPGNIIYDVETQAKLRNKRINKRKLPWAKEKLVYNINDSPSST